MAAQSTVLIEGSVILQIIKQSREQLPNAAYGKTMGHVTDDSLTITRCYPVSSEQQDYSQEAQQTFFEGTPCGLYTSASLDDSEEALSELLNVSCLHQRSNPSAVLILYNPSLTQHGMLSLRVVRVSEKHLKLEETKSFTAEQCVDLNPSELFENVNFTVHNSHLIAAYLFELTQDPKLSHMMLSYRELLDPAPTIVSQQLLQKLLEKSGTTSNLSLLDSYTYSLERFQRDTSYLQRQRADYTKRVNDIRIENQRRAQARLNPINIPEQPNFNDPSLQEIHLNSTRITNVAEDLSTLTELAHLKQTLLKKFITQEGQYVIE